MAVARTPARRPARAQSRTRGRRPLPQPETPAPELLSRGARQSPRRRASPRRPTRVVADRPERPDSPLRARQALAATGAGARVDPGGRAQGARARQQGHRRHVRHGAAHVPLPDGAARGERDRARPFALGGRARARAGPRHRAARRRAAAVSARRRRSCAACSEIWWTRGSCSGPGAATRPAIGPRAKSRGRATRTVRSAPLIVAIHRDGPLTRAELLRELEALRRVLDALLARLVAEGSVRAERSPAKRATSAIRC